MIAQTMYSDDDKVMISALQHFVFCKRQCALIHIEQVWRENSLTASGRVLHEHVDTAGSETRRDVRQATALRLTSGRLGLVGVADMLEFHRISSAADAAGRTIAIPLKGQLGVWQPFPVEYKRGNPKEHRADEVQLCAQAICLEEMLKVSIPSGALFYGKTRRRTLVAFDEELRSLTQEIADGVHQLLASGRTPPPVYSKRCESCSILEECNPRLMGTHGSAKAWLNRQVEEAIR